ncbi:MAG: fructose-6-phosphate aldolase [Bacilli bacterium]|nr:fructose-6-phosphate aldolase [Bacilli bacterium]
MILFIDTANLKEIEDAADWGYVKGCTTNPSLIAKEGLKQKDVIAKITTLIDGPISAEVTAEDYEGMIEQGKELFAIDPKHIVIKLPMTNAGLKAAKTFKELGIPTNVTLCFSAAQALLAMEAGATYVSPFLGRLDDNGWEAIKLIEDIVTMKMNYGYDTKIIAASIRNTEHVQQCALAGSDIATIPYGVLKKLIKHPLTDDGLEQFRVAAAKTAALGK